ncbi:MAG: TlpA family protein disulfide reductase [Sulfurovaceae bacterium]|nr:TlpA family protein disulfide reductase [Sulfurovaceae bacterium]
MIRYKRNAILATTLLFVTLSTTGCIQKQEIPVRSVIHKAPQQQQQQQQQLGAKTVPYTESTRPYIQPVVQYQQPVVQQRQQPTIIHQQPTVQYTQPTVQYTQPAVKYVQPRQESIQYIEPQLPAYEEEEGCTEDISTNGNNCDRGSIDKTQLSSNYTQQSSGGTMHSFKSVQGSAIQIGERKNGFTFPSHPGKVVILEMFGKTCPHCIKEIPTLKKLKSRYGSKLEVVGIHSQGIMGKSTAKRFISQHRINYPIIDSTKATDLQYFIQNTYGWTGVLPFTMVIKDGVTEGSISGEASYKELKEIIDPLF